MEYMGLKKYKDVDKVFHESVKQIIDMNVTPIDYIHQWPCYTGPINLARFLMIYDLFKEIQPLAGQYADIGTWKGSSFLFIAKLIRLFENNTINQVHGFDWFQGMNPDGNKKDDVAAAGKYKSEYDTLMELIKIQHLEDVAVVHKMDIVKELDGFFEKYDYLQFKYVYLDCGIHDVINKSLEHFWPRLVPGGLILFDHYNTEACNAETHLVNKFLGNTRIYQCDYSRQPTAYAFKE